MKRRGFTVIEVLIVLAMLAILFAVAFNDLRPLSNPLRNGQTQVAGFFKQVRVRAMATTSAYQVLPSTNPGDNPNRVIIAQYANTCSAGNWTIDPNFRLELPQGVQLSGTTWSLCFSSRGFANPGLTVGLANAQGQTRQVEILLGGGVSAQ